MSGIDRLNARMTALGGQSPIGRMNNAKLRSLQGALKNSYQSASILELEDGTPHQCLISPDVMRPDYDNKVISIEHDAGMRAGSTFYWIANNTYWLIMLRELTETAYLRARIRRCRHKLVINDVDYYVHVQGPTETDIKWGQKSGITWNSLNHSLTMYVRKTEDSLLFFKRFNQITLDGLSWRIEATDSISTEGLIQVSLGEYFDNDVAALQIMPEVTPINTSLPHIAGPEFVKPYATVFYEAVLAEESDGRWLITGTGAKLLDTTEGTSAEVEVTTGKSGSFTLIYEQTFADDLVFNITIESL